MIEKIVDNNQLFDFLAALNRKIVPILTVILGIVTVVLPVLNDWSVETGIGVGVVVAVLGVLKATLNHIIRLAQHEFWSKEEV